MRLFYGDYITLVIGRCNKMRQDGTSSSFLASATPANLKQECLNVYTERIEKGEKKDEKVWKDFFGVPPEGRGFDNLIKRCSTDKFKPLQNLINGKTKNPDITIVELLAWLIDFRHRPFVHEMNVELNEEEWAILPKPVDEARENSVKTIESENLPPKGELKTSTEVKADVFTSPLPLLGTKENAKKMRVMPIAVLLIAVIFLAGYIFWPENRFKQMSFITANTGCMYWTGDRYEQIACSENQNDRFKFPLDFQKMKHFRRITQTDTITEKSIGNIYYIRINGGIEYYTIGGKHPVDITRTLQPLSTYMFNKHLRKKALVDKAH
jgi:hypothetical protein